MGEWVMVVVEVVGGGDKSLEVAVWNPFKVRLGVSRASLTRLERQLLLWPGGTLCKSFSGLFA